jgi:SAM-dependent methyltransferase
MARDYVYDQGFAEERARLAGMEALWDPGSRALLDELGLGDGWKCLEVGAGGGALVEWMAGRGATVTAIDIDTRFIEHLASDSITVRRIDVREDELPQAEFDLVHARLVLEHLTDRRQILDRLAATLRPGGWIVIEDYDWSAYRFDDEEQGFSKVADAIMEFMQRAGYERDYGRRVVGDIADAGFTEVRGEGRVRIIDSSSPGFDFFSREPAWSDCRRRPAVGSGGGGRVCVVRRERPGEHAHDDGRNRPPRLTLGSAGHGAQGDAWKFMASVDHEAAETLVQPCSHRCALRLIKPAEDHRKRARCLGRELLVLLEALERKPYSYFFDAHVAETRAFEQSPHAFFAAHAERTWGVGFG